MLARSLLSLLCLFCASHVLAQDPAAREAFERTLRWQHGEVVVPRGIARLRLGERLRWLDKADTFRVMDVWGNRPRHDYLGMVFPTDRGALHPARWGVLVWDEPIGRVEDDGAGLEPQALLREMKAENEAVRQAARDQRSRSGAGRALRAAGGEPPLPTALVGWTTPPRWDPTARTLDWGVVLQPDGGERTVNIHLRILHRRGALALTAVGPETQRELIERRWPEVVAAVEIEPGHRWSELDPAIDLRSSHSLADLVRHDELVGKDWKWRLTDWLARGGWRLITGAVVALITLGGAIAAWRRRRS